MADIIEFTQIKKEPQCSFCKTPKSKCKRLVGNSEKGTYICDKCLLTCSTILTKEKERA